jgi:outer membrane protein assembly factor BamE (lipoprotein component of BamABCDE complex)
MIRQAIISIILLFAVIGCGGSPLATGQIAEKNKIELMQLKSGMSMAEVRNIMGNPYKIGKKHMGKNTYEVWYYITTATFLGQSQYLDENFTPVIFQHKKLMGWGYHYYDYLMDVNNAQNKAIDAEKQKYIKSQKKPEKVMPMEEVLKPSPYEGEGYIEEQTLPETKSLDQPTNSEPVMSPEPKATKPAQEKLPAEPTQSTP